MEDLNSSSTSSTTEQCEDGEPREFSSMDAIPDVDHLSSLPADCLLSILSFFNQFELRLVSHVSHAFNVMVEQSKRRAYPRFNQLDVVPQNQRKFNFAKVRYLHYDQPVPYGYDFSCLEYRGGGKLYGNVNKTRAVTRGDGKIRDVAIKDMDGRSGVFGSVHKARRVFRELRMLQLLQHNNIIRLLDVYSPDKDLATFKNMYMVTAYAEYTLYEIMRDQRENNVIHLTLDHAKFIVYQFLKGLKYLHSANITHDDLEPKRLSINRSCDLVIRDFEHARDIAMRWYAAPENMYWKIGSCAKQADVWSVGCLAAEMMIYEPLFPGKWSTDQFNMITELCGAPDLELLQRIGDKQSPYSRQVIERLSLNCQRQYFNQYFRVFNSELPYDAISFLDEILQLNPDKRFTVDQALQHPFLSEYRDPKDEPVANAPLIIEDDDAYTIDDWKRLIWNEIQNFRGGVGSPAFI